MPPATLRTLATDLRCALDPVVFAQDRLRFDPDPWQAEALRSLRKRTLLNCGRQVGKSTVAAIKGLHRAEYRPGSLVLLGSPSLRQSRELASKVMDFMESIEHHEPLEEDNATSATLANGSRIVCLPGSAATVRGYSAPDLIVEDESAYVDESFHTAIRPMLAVSDGELMLLSTPNGKRGHFYEAWSSDDDWQRIEIWSKDCPRISPEFLAKERRWMGDAMYRQEYECHFADAVGQVFPDEDIARAFTDEVKPLFEAA